MNALLVMVAAPEFVSWALMLIGVAGIGCAARRQRLGRRLPAPVTAKAFMVGDLL